MKLEIPILVSDPVLNLDQVPVVVEGVEVDVECFTADRESLMRVRCMLEKEWNLENVRRIMLWGLGRRLKIALGNKGDEGEKMVSIPSHRNHPVGGREGIYVCDLGAVQRQRS